MAMLHYLTAILGCALLVSAVQQCANFKTVSEFKVKNYTGLWYQVGRMISIYEGPSDCSTERYKEGKNGEIDITRSMCLYNTKIYLEGSAKNQTENSAKDGKLNVTYSVLGDQAMPYWVLDTDYTNYAIVISCTNRDISLPSISELGWILSRTTTLSEENNKKIDETLKKNKISRDIFMPIKHENCCYDATKENSAATVGFSLTLLISTLMVRFV